MSNSNIRAALDAHLEAYTPSLQIAWENSKYKPVVGTPFVRVDLLPARTDNPELTGTPSNDMKVYMGIYQLRLYFPVNAGPNAAGALADALVEYFPRGLSVAYGGTTVRVPSTPYASASLPGDGVWYVVPVSIPYRSEVF